MTSYLILVGYSFRGVQHCFHTYKFYQMKIFSSQLEVLSKISHLKSDCGQPFQGRWAEARNRGSKSD